jgi:hypothetical protein
MTTHLVRVRRTGGLIGRPVEATVDLGAGDARAGELRRIADLVLQPGEA